MSEEQPTNRIMPRLVMVPLIAGVWGIAEIIMALGDLRLMAGFEGTIA
jgi:hypothetical protein